MPLFSICEWLKKSLTTSRGARRNRRRAFANFRPRLESLEDRCLPSANVQMAVNAGFTLYSYAGVGFQENDVATMQVSVNFQPDVNKGDFQAQIQWGNGATSAGDLVFEGTDGNYADYLIKGSNVYQKTGSDIPILVAVSGPDGTSATFGPGIFDYANVAAMPSGIPGIQPPKPVNPTAPADVNMGVNAGFTLSSYAGVGFQENDIATMQVSVNGQPDPMLGDFTAQINWGASAAWVPGQFVFEGTDGNYADYLIKGSNVYQKTGSRIPITVYVTGPDGTSATFGPGIVDYANVAAMPSGIPGKQPAAPTNPTPPSDVDIQVNAGFTLNSYAGIGFQENEIATLQVAVNGQADPTPSDFTAQINWGDSAAWAPGQLVYEGTDGNYANFIVKGSHTYQYPGSDIPIVVYVTGPDGTSATFGPGIVDYANVAPALNPNYVAADFPGQGVYLYANGAWTSLHTIDANSVAVDPYGQVVAAFGKLGVYLYSGGAWNRIANAPASQVDIAGPGIAVAEFPGFGVYRYENSVWQRLATAPANSIAVDDNGDVVGAFGSLGVYLYKGTAWIHIANAAATHVAIAGNGLVAAEFPGLGLFEYQNAKWTNLSTNNATSIGIDASGDVVAAFGSAGIYLYEGVTPPTQIATGAASIVGITNGAEVVAEFPGSGVFLTPFSGPAITTMNASLLGISE
jgi:hypothetical protein